MLPGGEAGNPFLLIIRHAPTMKNGTGHRYG
jgi:hypothetical protein